MFMKTLFALGASLLVAGTTVYGSAVTITTPAELAKKQEVLSTKIVASYSKHQDLSGVLRRLEEQQKRMKKSIHDPEISNMIDFLQLCLENIKDISMQPRTRHTTERIADLGASINEGSRYIVRKLN